MVQKVYSPPSHASIFTFEFASIINSIETRGRHFSYYKLKRTHLRLQQVQKSGRVRLISSKSQYLCLAHPPLQTTPTGPPIVCAQVMESGFPDHSAPPLKVQDVTQIGRSQTLK